MNIERRETLKIEDLLMIEQYEKERQQIRLENDAFYRDELLGFLERDAHLSEL